MGVTFRDVRIRFSCVQVTSTRFLPLLVSIHDGQIGDQHVLDEFSDGIAVAYVMGPPYGQRLVTWSDLSRLNVARRNLRRAALHNLDMGLGAIIGVVLWWVKPTMR